jgi:hypothetical protein
MTKPKGKRKRIDRGPKLSGTLPLGHPGRPAKFDETLCPRVHKLALLGMTDAEIAHHLGIDEKTLHTWKAKYPLFLQSLQGGKIDADARIAAALFDRAAGNVRVPSVKIFMPPSATEPVYAPYVEHLPPDVGAAKLWLLNRQPGRWRERREVEMTVSLEQEIARLTPEERRQRLRELQIKAGLLIEGEADGDLVARSR